MRKKSVMYATIAFAALLLWGSHAGAQDIGKLKTASGAVFVERDGARQAAKVGQSLRQTDVVSTGADGKVGLTFADNSRLSLGPDSALELIKFSFNSTTHVGEFGSSLRRGTLAVKSGKIARQTPEAMTVRTPASVLAVRGTEFVVKAGE